MKEIWTKPQAEYHGEFVNFDPIIAWPKPVQKPYPPILVGGGSRMPHAAPPAMATAQSRSGSHLRTKSLPSSGDGGGGRHDPDACKIDLMAAPEDLDALKRYRDMGINRVTVFLPPDKDDAVLPILDRWAELIRKI